MASTDKGLEEIPECKISQYTQFIYSMLAMRKPSKKYAKFVIFTAQIESNYDEITDSFDAMNLKSELLRGMLAGDVPSKAPRS